MKDAFKNIPILIPLHITCNIKKELNITHDTKWDLSTIPIKIENHNIWKFSPINVLVAVDHHYINGCNLNLYSKLEKIKGLISSEILFHGVTNKTKEQTEYLFKSSNFVITKTSFQGPEFTNINNEFIKNLLNNKNNKKTIKSLICQMDHTFIFIHL